MSYIAIPNADVAAGAPVTTALMTALRDNPIAIAEGASGAPRITAAALNYDVFSGIVTSSTSPIQFTNLPGEIAVIELYIAKDVGLTTNFQIAFSTDNGSSWGSYQTFFSFNSNTDNEGTVFGVIRDNTIYGQSHVAGFGTGGVIRSTPSISIPAGANAFRIRSDRSDDLAVVAKTIFALPP